MISPSLRLISLTALLVTGAAPVLAQSSAQALPDAPAARVLASSSEGASWMQTQASIQEQTPTTRQKEKNKRASEIELRKELHQRMAGVVPNFNAVLGGKPVPPLSPRQKMHAAFRSAIDPYQFGLAAITSGIGQAENSHAGYGQGFQGYAKRYGAGFTDQFDGTILGNGVFPILFHQDSRYYRMGTGSFMHRLLYSMSTTVRCKGDNGRWQPNYSNLLGNLAAGGISNLYYPAEDRGFGLTIQQGLTVTAEGVFGAALIEFYPDIRRHFQKKHTEQTGQ